MSILVIPRINVTKFNVLTSQWLISPMPVYAINMFIHNLQLKTGVICKQVSIVHHDFQYKAGVGDYYALYFEKQKGAMFIDGIDYAYNNSPNPPKTLGSIAEQPSCLADMTISLIIDADEIDLDKVNTFLYSAKIAGGNIQSHQPPRECEFKDIFKYIKSGFFVEDRQDLINANENQLEQYVELLYQSGKKDDKIEKDKSTEKPNSWLSSTTLGYAKLTKEKPKAGVRNGVEHCFVEPIIGLIQYKSIHNFRESISDIKFWKYDWINQDVFMCYQ